LVHSTTSEVDAGGAIDLQRRAAPRSRARRACGVALRRSRGSRRPARLPVPQARFDATVRRRSARDPNGGFPTVSPLPVPLCRETRVRRRATRRRVTRYRRAEDGDHPAGAGSSEGPSAMSLRTGETRWATRRPCWRRSATPHCSTSSASQRQHVRLQVYGHHLASTGRRCRSGPRHDPHATSAGCGRAVREFVDLPAAPARPAGRPLPYFYTFKRLLFWGRLLPADRGWRGPGGGPGRRPGTTP